MQWVRQFLTRVTHVWLEPSASLPAPFNWSCGLSERSDLTDAGFLCDPRACLNCYASGQPLRSRAMIPRISRTKSAKPSAKLFARPELSPWSGRRESKPRMQLRKLPLYDRPPPYGDGEHVTYMMSGRWHRSG